MNTEYEVGQSYDIVLTASTTPNYFYNPIITIQAATPVANSFTATAVAYNTGSAGATSINVSGQVTNSPTSYAVGSATTAQGGSVSITNAGVASYTPPVGYRGNDGFTYTASNAGGTSNSATVTVPVNNPTLVSTLAGSGQQGTALSGVQINTTGGRATYSCATTPASGTLPGGVSLNANCTLSGTPTNSGAFTFTASVTDSSLGTGPFTQTSGTLTLNIAALPTFNIADVTVTEGSGAGTTTAVFNITLSAPAPSGGVSFNIATADGTAVAGADYTANSVNGQTIAAGANSGTFSVTIDRDVLDEANETFLANVTTLTGAIAGDTTGQATITDDDAPPTINVSSVSVTEGNSGSSNATVTFTLSAASGQAVTANWTTSPGTATAGSDYTTTTSPSLSFAPGTTVLTRDIPVLGDATIESDETFTVGISGSPVNATAGPSGTVTIVSDELPSALIGPVSINTTESNSPSVITVALNQAVTTPTTVNVAITGTATSGSDYTGAVTSVVIPATQTFAEVIIDPTDDALVEGSETVIVTIGSGTGYQVGSPSVSTVTIADNDTTTLSIAGVTVTEGDSGTVDATFTVSLTQPRQAGAGPVTFDIATADGTATVAGGDYQQRSLNAQTIAETQTTYSFTVQVNGDALNEANETFLVNITNVTGATLGVSQGQGTITNNDAQPSFSINDVSLTEGNAGTTNAVFTVTLSAASGRTTSVVAQTANGTATAGIDYTAVGPTTLSFAEGAPLTQTFTVPILGDTAFEADETFVVNLTGPVNATVADPSGQGTIRNDEPSPPAVTSLSPASGPAAGGATITINGSNFTGATNVRFATVNTSFTFISDTQITATSLPCSGTIDVSVTTAAGTSANTAADDFTCVAAPTVTSVAPSFVTTSGGVNVTLTGTNFTGVTAVAFGATPATSFNFVNATTITAVAPAAASGPVNVRVTTPGGTSATAAGNQLTYVGPTLSIDDRTVTEGNGGTTTASFTVSLSAPAPIGGVTFDIATADGTATTASGDYVTRTLTTQTIAAGATSYTFDVSIAGDTVNEVNETVLVNVTNVTNATISDGQGQLTITNDDARPSISINDVTIVEGDTLGTAFAVFTVSLSGPSSVLESVNFITSAGTATAGSDYTTTGGSFGFNPGQTTRTVTVNILSDTVAEPNETFSVVIGAVGSETIADGTGVGTIVNDDAPDLTVNDVTLSEGNAGTTAFTFTVNLSQPALTGGVTFDIATNAGSATAGSDFATNSAVGQVIAAGASSATFTVQVNGDLLNEPGENFFVNVSNVIGAVVTDSSGQGLILNDDAVPSLSVSDVSVTEGDGGTTNAVFTVTLSAQSGQTVSVNFATADGTALAGADYVAQSAGFSFTPGTTTRTVSVAVNGDIAVEGNEGFVLDLSGATNATIADGQGAGTILDDDALPSIASLTPNMGRQSGGIPVVIAGSGFTGATAVNFNTTPAASFVVDGDTQITAVTPSGFGFADVTVVTPKGTSLTGATTLYQYVLSNISALSNLTLSNGVLAPAFAGGTLNYTASVGSGVATITVTPNRLDNDATITVNGVTTPSGAASAPIALNVGVNTISVVVTAQDGVSTTSYSVQVTRAQSSVSTLSGLIPSAGALSPAFSAGVTGYAVAVGNGATGITLTPTATDVTATIAVNGSAVASGAASGSIPLNVGANVITTVVTAQDGVSTTTYTTTVTRAGSAVSSLSGLVLSSGPLTPTFSSGVTGYTASVPNGAASVTLTPTTTQANATVTVNGAPVASGAASGPLALAVGDTPLSVVVTAQDGVAATTYTVVVSRAEAAPVAGGASLTVGYNAPSTPVPLALSGGPTTSVAVATPPANGSVVVSGATATYRPAAGFSGADSFAYTATGPGGTSAPATVSVVVGAPAIAVAPSSLAAAQRGAVYSQTVSASGGQAPYAFAVTAGALPAGLTLSSAGVLSGTPQASGSFNLSITATDSSTGAGPFSAIQAYALTVAAPVVALSPAAGALPAGTVGAAYSQTLAASGAVAPYSFAVTSGALPAGLTLASNGALSGTPTASGSHAFTVTATDSATAGSGGPYAGSAAYSVIVNVAAPTASNLTATAPYNAGGAGFTAIDLSAGTGGAVTSYAVGAAANGSVAVVGSEARYTPLAGFGGTDSFTYTATGPGGVSSPATVTVTVSAAAVAITPASLPNGQRGAVYNATLSASGGRAPYGFTVSAGALPAGLTLSASGALSGTPQASGSFAFSVRAQDSSTGAGPYAATRAYVLIVAAPVVALSPPAGALPAGRVGAAYSQTLAASGAVAPYSFAVTAGSLPAGLALASDGTLSGAPTASGSYSFTVTATDGSTAGSGGPYGGAAAYSLVVGDAAPTAAASSLTVAYGAAATNVPLTLSGGPVTSVAVSTAPTRGVATASGATLTYTPAVGAFGTDTFAYVATGPGGSSAPAMVTVTIGAPTLAIGPAALADGQEDVAYAATLTASGGAAPYSFAITAGALPAGVILSSAGALSGTPTVMGDYAFTVTATDSSTGSGPASVTRAFALRIAAPAPPVVRPRPGTVSAGGGASGGEPVRIDLGALVTGDYTEIRIVTPPQNGTVVLEQGGQASAASVGPAEPLAAGPRVIAIYTARAGYTGPDGFTFLAVGPGGTSAPAAVSITVTGSPPVAADLFATTEQGRPVTVDLTGAATEGPFTAATVVSVTPTGSASTALIQGGVASARTYGLTVTPRADFEGQLVVTYTLGNSIGVSAPATVTVTVRGRPDPSADPTVRALTTAQAQASRLFATTQLGNFNRRNEQLHGAGEGRGQALGVSVSSGLNGMLTTPMGDLPWAARENQLAAERADLMNDMPNRWDQFNAGAAGSSDAQAEAVGQSTAPGSGSSSGDGPRAVGSVSVWSGGAITIGGFDQTTRTASFDVTTSGVSGGADVKLSEQLTVGGGGGFGTQRTKIGEDEDGRLDGDSWTGAVYGSWRPAPGAFIDGVLGYATLDFDTRRLAGNGLIAHGEREGDMVMASLTGGWDRNTRRTTLSTYGRFDYVSTRLDAYSETGADLYNLSFAEREFDSLTGALGVRGQVLRPLRGGVLTQSGRFEWRHEFSGLDGQRLDYADIGGFRYSIDAERWMRDEFAAELGLEIIYDSGLTLGVDVGARFSDTGEAATLRMLLAKRF